MTQPTYLSTTAVARQLGVSVASIKRWVDEGVLPAHKTAGGHRRILQSDLQRLVKQNHFPQVEPAPAAVLGKSGDAIEFHEESQKLYEALSKGDTTAVRALVSGHFHHGLRLEVLADEIICPALDRVGADWEQGKIDVYREHNATRICEAVLFELKADLEQTAEYDGPTAIGGCPENDPTVVTSLLAQMTLLENGWRAINFGPHTPLDSLSKAMQEFQPKLLWLTLTHPLEEREQFLTEYQQLYKDAEDQNVAVALGGRSLTAELRSRMPYTMFGDGMGQLASFARSLHHSYQRPRRGRPPINRETREHTS